MKNTDLVNILTQRSALTDVGITFIDGGDKEDFLSYKELYEASLKALSYFEERGIKPKEELVFQISDNRTFIIVFWACILGGIIPVPITVGQNDEHKQKLFKIWPILNNPYLIIKKADFDKLNDFSQKAQLQETCSEIEKRIVEIDGVYSSNKNGEIIEANEQDIAFIQFSSGSTGSPKGIVLTHRNLIHNMESISNASNYTQTDTMLSWMPLTHDMGLIGFHLNPLYCGMQHYIMPTNLFVRRPALWMAKASQHNVSILCSPNFGYKYILTHCSDASKYNWDLSHVRILYNGAEPISEKLCSEFSERLSQFKLSQNAMCPVYGLAEASLAVSISKMEDEVVPIHLKRDNLNIGDRVIIDDDTEDSVTFINVGRPIDYCELRITNNNILAEDGVIGEVEIRGENVTMGYYNNPEETKKVLGSDGWLKTGDLGFVTDESFYITGRAKDIVFVNGQNYYPHDIERVAEEVDGIELNKVVVTGHFNNDTQKEETICFVFHRGDIEQFVSLSKTLRAHVNLQVGFEFDRIVPVKNIPRTTSGKLQRFKLLEYYKDGDFKDIEEELLAKIKELNFNDDEIVKPENEPERQLHEIWQKVLKIDAFGVTDDFIELGGNSLKAAEMMMLVAKEFQVELSIEALYEHGSIRELATELLNPTVKEYQPIAIADTQNSYALSAPQKRLFYAWQLDPTAISYNIPVALRINGKIEIAKVEESVRQLIERHDTLRMTFVMEKEPKFKITDTVPFQFNYINSNEEELNGKLKSLVKPFDLSNGPLFNIQMIGLKPTEHILFLDFHHIISDGVSVYNFVNELFEIYEGKKPSVLPIQYKDYALWEKNALKPENIASQEEYWTNLLQDELPILELPTDYIRPAILDTQGKRIEGALNVKTSSKLRKLAKLNGCSLHAVFFGLYNILLSKYTGQEDMVIGIPIAGRRHPDLQYMQGMFVNNLAIRNTLKGDESFVQLLESTKQNLIESQKNQDYPFERLIERIVSKREVNRNPIFDTMFNYQNMGMPQVANVDFSISKHSFDPGFSKFDLSLEIFDHEESITYGFEYATKLFKEETILRLAEHFDNLVTAVINNPDSPICDLSILSDKELEDYNIGFNTTQVDYPREKTIHQLFEAQAVRCPNNIAVRDHHGHEITYKELNGQVNAMAHQLLKSGMKRGSSVAILLDRSSELIISILGVLKAGGCYIPMDTDLPMERVRYMIKDSECELLITSTEHKVKALSITEANSLPIFNVGDLKESTVETANVENGVVATDVAYVIYTSGTTGHPKGVMITHQSLVNYCDWASKVYLNGEEVSFPLFTSISFDLTVTSLFVPLITGNSIVIYEEDGKNLLIDQIVADNQVDIIKLTPSHLKLLIQNNTLESMTASRLKKMIVGGEQLSNQLAELVRIKFNDNVEIFNEYGPTEATVGCMIYNYAPNPEGAVTVPIGKPAQNTQIYVLDKYLKPVPIGVHGEIHVSGDGLASAYRLKSELTAQKFIPNPYLKGKRMYKTGDLAKRLPNGDIEFIERIDQQVKINGHRIELGEIESAINAFPAIEESIVVVNTNDHGASLLYSYYRIKGSETEKPDNTLLRNHLANILPHYMIPVHFVEIKEIPLTNNGKIDYHSLPDPSSLAQSEDKVLPTNEIQKLSLDIWEDILGKKNLSITDNFFELGGDSIKAIQITSRLMDKGISLTVKDILTYHTIEQISVSAKIGIDLVQYEQGTISGERALLPIESWFFSKNFKNPNYYNQSVLLEFKEEADIKILEHVFQKLVEYHDGLRLNFDLEKQVLYYNNEHLHDDFVIEEYDLNPTRTVSLAEVCQQVKSGFDLAKSLLIKAAVIKKEGTQMLFVTAHHILVDGITWRILLEDLSQIYFALKNGAAPELPKKTASLLDWKHRVKAFETSKENVEKRSYWKQTQNLNFNIPQDIEIDNWFISDMCKSSKSLDKDYTAFLLKEAHQTYKTDVPILLNVALALTLNEWTGQDWCVVEQESHGRHFNDIDVSRTSGWLTSMYPVKLEMEDCAIGKQIQTVKEQLRTVPNSGMGYNKEFLREHSKKSSSDITPIRLNYLGQFDRELNNELFAFSNEYTGSESDPINYMTAKLELNSMVIHEEFSLEVSYNGQAHKKSSIDWFLDKFFQNLLIVLDHIKNENEVHFTPSDFDLVGLDQDELDGIFQ